MSSVGDGDRAVAGWSRRAAEEERRLQSSFPVRNGTQTGNVSATNRALNVTSGSEDETYFVLIVCVVGESRRVGPYLLTCLCFSKSASSSGALMPTQADVIGFKNYL